jgi:cytosine/uracil/thiamine/allantoin permease
MKKRTALILGIALVMSSAILTRFEVQLHDFVQGLFVGVGIALSVYALVCISRDRGKTV